MPWGRITVGPRRRVVSGPAGWVAVGVTVALVGVALFGTGLLGQPGADEREPKPEPEREPES